MTEQSYRYPKDNWTASQGRTHCKEHEGTFEPAVEEGATDMSIKGAIPYKSTPLAPEDTTWDAASEVKAAEVDDLKIMCTWVGEDPENKTSYKLPHHKAAGEHACVWAGVRAVAAVLMGARGGANIPDADLKGVKAHIAKHYSDFDKGEPPWEKGITQAEIGDELDYMRGLIEAEGLGKANKALAAKLASTIIERIPGGDIPVDIQSKVGAVLNAKNRENLKQALVLIQGVLDSAEKPVEETAEETFQADIGEIASVVIERLFGKKMEG